jgi:hypothetical protein
LREGLETEAKYEEMFVESRPPDVEPKNRRRKKAEVGS